MKSIKTVISLLLVLSVLLLSGCSALFKPNPVEPNTVDSVTDDEEDIYAEYPVTKYELKDNAFEISGDINRYIYDELDGADEVINTVNRYFDINLKVDEEINYENGYANWFWEEGENPDVSSASISASSKTGKFSFYYKPYNEKIVSASNMGAAEEDKLLEKATEFADKFSFVTGKLTFDHSVPDDSLFYPVLSDDGEDTKEIHLFGRKFLFCSEQYSKQTVSANGELDCYVECGSSDMPLRNVQYFVVTMLADGTIVSADNYITKANISENGTWKMITEENMDEVLSYFTSTAKDDKMIISRIYIDSYSNYFGYPEIDAVIKLEFCFESAPDDVQTTEIAIEGFYTNT